MNRREMLAASLAAATGIDVVAEEISSEPAPLLVVLYMPDDADVDDQTMRRVEAIANAKWNELWRDDPRKPKLMVVPGGFRVQAIVPAPAEPMEVVTAIHYRGGCQYEVEKGKIG
jgi:hypothetical protein